MTRILWTIAVLVCALLAIGGLWAPDDPGLSALPPAPESIVRVDAPVAREPASSDAEAERVQPRSSHGPFAPRPKPPPALLYGATAPLAPGQQPLAAHGFGERPDLTD